MDQKNNNNKITNKNSMSICIIVANYKRGFETRATHTHTYIYDIQYIPSSMEEVSSW